MKKVKTRKFLWTLLPMMAAALMTTACSSDDDSTSVSPKPAADQTVKTIPYTVTVGQGTTTRATVADDNKTLQFAAGDELYVENKDANVYGRLTLQSGDAGKNNGATFSGNLNYTGSAPTDNLELTATLVGANDELANEKDGKVMGFENYPTTICATMAEAVQKYSKLTGSSTYGEKSFALSQETAFLKFSITLSGTTAGSDVSVVIKNGSSTIGTGTVTATAGTSSVKADFVLALATGTEIAAGSKMNVGTKEIVYSSAGMTLSGGVYEYEGEVPGQGFTANSSGVQVVFSPGNLQYQASTDTWRFAEHQYDYVGDATNGNVYVGSTKSNNANISSSYNGWIDLFGWGTSNKTFASGYGSATQPWSTSNNMSAYGPTGTSNGLYGAFANGDWGVNMTGPYTWRTLTGGSGGEWEYIFSTRTSGATVNGTSNARYTEATINTDGTPVNGMILFPDGCKINSSSATSWGNINSASTWDNATKCTTSQWTHLEELGCVFLPAAGFRDNDKQAKNVGSFGSYWSSSPHASLAIYAHLVRIYSEHVEPAIYGNRWNGFSVRLVREVE